VTDDQICILVRAIDEDSMKKVSEKVGNIVAKPHISLFFGSIRRLGVSL
jgi:hypothetical protein